MRMLMARVSLGTTEPAMPENIIYFEKDVGFASLASTP
jgi:hypothetical protein